VDTDIRAAYTADPPGRATTLHACRPRCPTGRPRLADSGCCRCFGGNWRLTCSTSRRPSFGPAAGGLTGWRSDGVQTGAELGTRRGQRAYHYTNASYIPVTGGGTLGRPGKRHPPAHRDRRAAGRRQSTFRGGARFSTAQAGSRPPPAGGAAAFGGRPATLIIYGQIASDARSVAASPVDLRLRHACGFARAAAGHPDHVRAAARIRDLPKGNVAVAGRPGLRPAAVARCSTLSPQCVDIRPRAEWARTQPTAGPDAASATWCGPGADLRWKAHNSQAAPRVSRASSPSDRCTDNGKQHLPVWVPKPRSLGGSGVGDAPAVDRRRPWEWRVPAGDAFLRRAILRGSPQPGAHVFPRTSTSCSPATSTSLHVRVTQRFRAARKCSIITTVAVRTRLGNVDLDLFRDPSRRRPTRSRLLLEGIRSMRRPPVAVFGVRDHKSW